MSEMVQRFYKVKSAVIPSDRPRRIMSLSTLINTFGNGLFMTIEVIYFTLIVGLSPAKVALALSIAGGIALSVSVPAGHISDRFGPRDIASLAMVLEGALMFALLSVHTYLPFLLVNIGMGVLGNISQTMRMATIAKLGEGEERVAIRAYQRAVTNFGISLGTVFAGIALAINTPIAYQILLAGDALTFILAGYVFRRMPYMEPTVERGEPISFQALRDKRFLGATALNAINSLHFVLQSVAIPLWVVRETTAPRWWVSVIMMVNTIAVMLFQVAASKGSGPVKCWRKALPSRQPCNLYRLHSLFHVTWCGSSRCKRHSYIRFSSACLWRADWFGRIVEHRLRVSR
jgi:MFS family permease